MDEFYKKVKENINQIPEQESNNDSWNKLNSYRAKKDKENSKKPIGFLPLLLASGLALLLFTSIYLFQENRSLKDFHNLANNQIDTVYITKYLSSTDTQLEETELKIDNAVQENRARLEIEKLSAQINRIKTDLSVEITKNRKLYFDLLTARSSVQELSQKQFEIASDIQLESELAKKATNKEGVGEFIDVDKKEILSYNTSYLDKYPFHFLDENLKMGLQLRPIYISRKKSKVKNPFLPKTISASVNTSYMSSSTDDFPNLNSYVVGGRAYSFFTRHVRGHLGFSLQNLESKIIDPGQYPLVPTMEDPEDSVLKYVKFTDRLIWLEAGFDYLLTPRNSFRPFAGIAYGSVLSIYPKFQYEYDTPDGEFYITRESAQTLYKAQYLILRLGTDYRISSKIDIGLMGQYRYKLQGDSYNYLGIDGSVYYHF